IVKTDATFTNGTLKFEGQGQLAQDAGKTLNFSKVAVVNNSQLVSGAALDSDTINFKANSTYAGGKDVRTKEMTFEKDATLNLGLTDDLVLAQNGNLNLKAGSTLNVEFAEDGKSVGAAVLSGTGAAKMEDGVVVNASNMSGLKNGTYVGTAIQTETTSNTFKSYEDNTAFYKLSAAASNDGKSYETRLEISANSMKFAKTANQATMAEYIDSIREQAGVSEALRSSLDDYFALKDGADVTAALESMGAVNRANALAMAMNNPWRQAFAHTTLADRRNYGASVFQGYDGTFRGQAQGYADGYVDSAYAGSGYGYYRGGAPRAAWYAQNYRGLDSKPSDKTGAFGVTDIGMNVGYETIRESGVVGG
ncbi:MAG: hypothetical protein HUK22_00805, partial [Thermoguttaceae bacterium]|nr:hypothetical protein [Thermoguttaceae bacterium]